MEGDILKVILLPLLTLSVWLSSGRTLAKAAQAFRPEGFFPLFLVYGIGVAAFAGLLFHAGGKYRRLEAFLAGGAWIVFTVASFILYPVLDARKFSGLGSTTDDALFEPARALMRGGSLYDVRLYDGAPISPGPGWILANLPFSLPGAAFLLNPFYLLLSFFFLRRWISAALLYRSFFLLLGSALFWDLTLSGSDLFALGLLLALSLTLAHAVLVHGEGRFFVISTVLTGLIATGRIVFLGLPLLQAWLIRPRPPSASLSESNPLRAPRSFLLLHLGLSMGLALGLHWIFSRSAGPYPPLHLLERGEQRTGLGILAGGTLLTLGLLFYFRLKPRSELRAFLGAGLACLGIPLATVALGEWRAGGFDFRAWEGANYFAPFLPLLAILVFWNGNAFWQEKGLGNEKDEQP